MKRYILVAAVAALCFLCTDVKASSLFGKVIDVSSGDVLTVFNLNRPVRVKLLGVDAPELDQAFGDVAKKHLSDLIFDQSVLVEYSGIAADGSVAGRVLLNNVDIGAQMIRDGTAWFDPNNLSRLSATDRDIYQQSEQTARSERRGLWQSENPIAPWEFVKTKALRIEPRASLNETAPAQKARGERAYAELTNLTLMTRGTAPTSRSPMTSTNEKDFAWAESIPTKGAWFQFRPAGEDFTALVPENGQQVEAQVPFAGEMGDVTIYLARDGWSTYYVQWLKAKTLGESDQFALSDGVKGFSMGLKEGLAMQGHSMANCGPANVKYISVSGLPAVEFDMTSCILRGRARIVTRLVDGKRQMYVVAVLYTQEDENITRFLNSLTIDGAKPPKKPLPQKGTKSTYQ